MRGLSAAIAALVLCVAIPASAGTHHSVRTTDPCRWSWTEPVDAGTDTDVDITRVTFALDREALSVAIHVVDLSAEAPPNGDQFRAAWGLMGRVAGRPAFSWLQMGGWRSPLSGTHPTTTNADLQDVAITYDSDREVVVMRVPRSALYAQMRYAVLEPTLTGADIGAGHRTDAHESVVTGRGDSDFSYQSHGHLSFAACDAALDFRPRAVRPDPRVDHVSFPGPCTTVVTDPVGDEDFGGLISRSRMPRPDLDITSVRYQMARHSITATIRIPDVASHPVGYWRQSIYVAIGYDEEGDQPANTDQGVNRGTTGSGYVGTPLRAVVDDTHGVVTITVQRNGNTDGYGLEAFAEDGVTSPDIADSSQFLTQDCDRQLSGR